MPLTFTPLKGIPLVTPGDSLVNILSAALRNNSIIVQAGDILVLAQKIVSKAEGRFVNLNTVTPSLPAQELAEKAQKDSRFVELVLRESNSILRVRTGTIIAEHKQGFVCANAGIDHSNVQNLGGSPEDWVLLLPEDADRSAGEIRAGLESLFQVPLGVLIIDSHGRAWRVGAVGTAIGLAGMPGLVDLRGEADMFGYALRVTQVGAADELGAAASLLMGQAAEAIPAVHVRGFPYPLREGTVKELIRPKELDMFR